MTPPLKDGALAPELHNRECGGWCGIRTHGPARVSGIQSRCISPGSANHPKIGVLFCSRADDTESGAERGNRTPDLTLTKGALCRLSYVGGKHKMARTIGRAIAGVPAQSRQESNLACRPMIGAAVPIAFGPPPFLLCASCFYAASSVFHRHKMGSAIARARASKARI